MVLVCRVYFDVVRFIVVCYFFKFIALILCGGMGLGFIILLFVCDCAGLILSPYCYYRFGVSLLGWYVGLGLLVTFGF